MWHHKEARHEIKSGFEISRERTVNRCGFLRTVYLILLSSKLIRLEDEGKLIYFADP